MPREYCSKCSYPTQTCICSHIIEDRLPFNITILQHPKESVNIKNTARLAKLVDSNIKIINSQSISSINALKNELAQYNVVLLYPNRNSKELTSNSKNVIAIRGRADLHLVVIDGTWRQAYQIWQTHTWLHSLPSFHFGGDLESKYVIRKSKLSSQLSTIEAVSKFSEVVYNHETSSLDMVLKGLTDIWIKYSQKEAP